MLRQRVLLVVIALLATTTLMCGFGAYDFDQDQFTRTEPELTQLAGDYLPTAETQKLIADVGGYPPQEMSIHLSADGTFEMHNIPDWWRTSYGTPEGVFDSNMGVWALNKDYDWWQVQFNFDNRRIVKDLSGDQPPYSLWFYIGDVDKGNVMIFQQVRESP